jgi:hypothetical protein
VDAFLRKPEQIGDPPGAIARLLAEINFKQSTPEKSDRGHPVRLSSQRELLSKKLLQRD